MIHIGVTTPTALATFYFQFLCAHCLVPNDREKSREDKRGRDAAFHLSPVC
jgi:hypothetical protein